MIKQVELEIFESKNKLINCISDSTDIYFLSAWGNIGDELIYEGTKTLLSGIQYTEINLRDITNERGHTALVSGSGGWTKHFHRLPTYLPKISQQFQRIIVLPSSYDVSESFVREIITEIKACYFACEMVSFNQIKDLCKSDLAHDCAFFYNYENFNDQEGKGILNAFRTDAASIWDILPDGNIDISIQCKSLEEWLVTIAEHEIIRTDRAHVMIAAAMLGKQVEYTSAFDHKVPAIAEYALKDLPVFRTTDPFTTQFDHPHIFTVTKKKLGRDPMDTINGTHIAQFADFIAERAGIQTEIIDDLCSLDTNINFPTNSVMIIPDGIRKIKNNPELVESYIKVTEKEYKTILVDDIEPSIDTDQVKKILNKYKLPLEFLGYMKDKRGKPKIISILSNSSPERIVSAPENFKIVALIATYNECDVIEPVIKHLYQNGISVYIIDNWSTDGTYEKLQQMQNDGVIGFERWPLLEPTDTYNWSAILKRKEKLSYELDADWFIHYDADEIRESPWEGINLRDAIYKVESDGYNAIDFTIIDFHPTDDNYQENTSLKDYFQYFEFGKRSGHFIKINAWRKTKIGRAHV